MLQRRHHSLLLVSHHLHWLLQKQKKSRKEERSIEERRLQEAKKVLKKGLPLCLACSASCPCFSAPASLLFAAEVLVLQYCLHLNLKLVATRPSLLLLSNLT